MFDSQGRQLPTPELVPFRLTPDIVDGFGISGVEGVFRRCSEETMRVLRAQSAVFITILEVFRYDPLQKWYVWQATPSIKVDESLQGCFGREGQKGPG
jgi:ataxia telangiectasia mutated family protein